MKGRLIMGQISRAGTYRAAGIVDSGVSLTTNGFPQFVANIRPTEIYDFDEQEWVDWSEQDEEIIAYLVLFGGNGKPTLTAKQLQKAIGWSGQSFKELNETNYEAVPFQFRVEENEYNDKITLQVSWIAEYDAVPGRQVQKLDAVEVKKLDKIFASQLKGFGGTKVATAGTAAPTVPVESDEAAKVEVEAQAEKQKKAVGKVTVKTDTLQAEPDVPAKTKKTAKTSADIGEGTCTKTDAWRYLISLIEDTKPDMPDVDRASLFQDAIQEIAPAAKKKSDITTEQWYEIKELCGTKAIGF